MSDSRLSTPPQANGSAHEITPLLAEDARTTGYSTPVKSPDSDVEDAAENAPRDEPDKDVPHPSLRVILPVLMFGVFVANVLGAVVLATNHHIASSFNALSSAAWSLNIYTLAQCAGQPLYGKLFVIFGRRSSLACCWLLFIVGDMVMAVSQAYWQALMARAISGMGTAGMVSMAAVVVADLVPVKSLGNYRAYINIVGTTARALGGPIGAWVSGNLSWRWCFIVPVPITLCGLTLVLWKMPTHKDDKSPADHEAGEAEKRSKLSRIDFLGAFSIGSFILSFLLTLDLAAKGARPIVTIPLALASVVFQVLSVIAEKYYAREPILPLGLVCRRDVLTPYMLDQAARRLGMQKNAWLASAVETESKEMMVARREDAALDDVLLVVMLLAVEDGSQEQVVVVVVPKDAEKAGDEAFGEEEPSERVVRATERRSLARHGSR